MAVDLNEKLEKLKKERDVLEKRKKAIKNKIIKKIDKKPVSDIEDIKKYAKATAEDIEYAIKGVNNSKSIADISSRNAKDACSLDDWEEKEKLNSEIKRIERRITELEQEIASVETQIKSMLKPAPNKWLVGQKHLFY